MATVIRRRRRGLLITSLLAAGSVLYSVFVFLPGQRELSDIRRKLRQQQQFVVASERLKSTIATTEAGLRQVSQYCDRWKCNRPLGRKLPEFLARVTQLAEQHGVTLVRLMPSRTEKLATFDQITLQITVAGGLEGVLALIRELDELPELHWVDKLEITPDPSSASRVACTFELVLFAGFSEKSD